MEVELIVTGGTSLEMRFQVCVNGKECGELQTRREELTLLADRLFGKGYKIINNHADN